MYLHKTTGMVSAKDRCEPSVKNTQAAKASPSAPAAKPSAAPAASHPASALTAAGLPADKLSSSIVSFARFFSLPLKPEVMAAIRRQALAPPAAPAMQPESVRQQAAETTPKAALYNRETLSLAAAAAESKGVELYPRGLEGFAEAIDPEWQKRHNPDGRNQRGRKNKSRTGHEQENAPIGPLTAAGLKEMALESAEKIPLLALLNRLPGKNGQRWIVLPFAFREDNREFRVSLRILIEAENRALNRVYGAALDIAEIGAATHSGTGRPVSGNPSADPRWLFVWEPECGTANRLSACRLGVYLQPEPSPKAAALLARELSHLLAMPPEHIHVKPRTESFPCESGQHDGLLRSINEAV